jgi:DNA-damage-inducible protein D
VKVENNKIILFQEKQVRREWHDEQWYFSVIDVIEILTDSSNPRKYWSVLKVREPQLATICSQLKMLSADGKKYKTDATNTEGVFRLIMSVPSPKAEPFKQWLANVGKERIEEMENPELAAQRSIDYCLLFLKNFRIFSDKIQRCTAPSMTITVHGIKAIR